MCKAGGRLFVDVTQMLASPVSRENVIKCLGKIRSAHERRTHDHHRARRFYKILPDDKKEQSPGKSNKGVSPADYQTLNRKRSDNRF